MNKLKMIVLILLTFFTLTSQQSISKEKYTDSKNLENIDKKFKLILNDDNSDEYNQENKTGNSDENIQLIDINTATAEEMLTRKISNGYVKKIINYREITGGFDSLVELKRISGIGEAVFQRLKKKFKISSPITKKPIYINKADETIFKYYNFQKKEIQTILKYININGRIKNNIELKNILTEKRYLEYKDLIRYDIN